MNLKHFEVGEFDSPDLPGSGEEMQFSFLKMLDNAREIADVPFKINSGFRTVYHNENVGGSPNSSHLRGYAADIHCTESVERFHILNGLIKAGFTRIGIAITFIHVDNDPTKDSHVIWTYD